MGLMSWLGLAAEQKEPLALDDDNFHEEVMRSDVPVLLDVWSPGCQPCVTLAPTIKRLAAKYEGQVKVCHLDASVAPQSMRKLRVRGTPTVLFFERGRVVETVVGVRGQHYYEEIIDEDLLETPSGEAPGAAQPEATETPPEAVAAQVAEAATWEAPASEAPAEEASPSETAGTRDPKKATNPNRAKRARKNKRSKKQKNAKTSRSQGASPDRHRATA